MDGSDPDGDEIILESGQGGEKGPPGVSKKKKKRRVLPWTEEGLERWPVVFRQVVSANNRVFDDSGIVEVVSAYVVPRGMVDDSGVVEVEDSEEEDDCSPLVVDERTCTTQGDVLNAAGSVDNDLRDRWGYETIRFMDSKYVDAKGRKWKTCGSSTWVPDEEP